MPILHLNHSQLRMGPYWLCHIYEQLWRLFLDFLGMSETFVQSPGGSKVVSWQSATSAMENSLSISEANALVKDTPALECLWANVNMLR